MVAQLEIKARFLGYSLTRLQEEVMKNPRYFADLLIGKQEFQDFRVIDSSNIETR
jgi:hypothetical protein